VNSSGADILNKKVISKQLKHKNMKANYTKGKWLTDEPTMTEITVCTEKMDICTVLCIDIEPEEAEANAQLIASAPELLEALNHLCETMRPYIMKLGIKKGFSEHAALAQAQTAIHKAIG
jgi:hypothetical protein